jgi:formylglycine-generating enzyme required for sulfatase activity
MSRNYGSLGRRSSSAAWQWVIIGMILGFGCSAIIVLGALAFGVLNLDGQSVVDLPTQTPFVITATPQPVTPTNTPSETVATEEALVVEPPTATPTIDPTLLTPEPTVTLTTPPLVGFGTTPQTQTEPTANVQGSTAQGQSEIEDRFAGVAAQASELVRVEGGTFEMGTNFAEVTAAAQECQQGYGGEAGACDVSMGEDSFPAHQVTVSPFWIERTEVTYAQFLAFLNALGPSSHLTGCFGQPCAQTLRESETSNINFDSQNYSVNIAINSLPVTSVTWYGAQAYCQAIGLRLPTEAEWERAARGPNNNLYPWDSDWDGSRAATRRNENGEPVEAQQVDAYPLGASVWGTGSVLNMAGNVAEWVSDWYDPNYYDTAASAGPDPQGPPAGTTKVNRGGSWDTMPFFARTVHRREQNPTFPTADIGFRCASDTSTGDSPLGSSPLPVTTVDPAALGVIEGSNDEESTANSQPTQPPPPTQPRTPTTQPTQSGTLDPGN